MSADARAEPRIEAIQHAYQLGYMAEEVRVTYKKDVKLTVGSVTIDAKEGDMSSLQRWVAKILAEQDAIEIQDNDLSGQISRAINRERLAKQHDLSGIDIDFYAKVNEHLTSLTENEKAKLIAALKKFIVLRTEKIVLLAAASPLSSELEAKLSAEERELYQIIHKASAAFKDEVLKHG